MRHFRHACLLLFCLSAICPTPVHAQFTPPGRTIGVTGNAEVRVVPDEVVLALGVETNNMVLTAAKQENDQIVKKILALTQSMKIEPRFVQTDYLNVEPRYEWPNSKRTFVGYYVRKSIAITLRDVAKFDDLLSGALSAGANYVHDVQFRTTELRKYRDQARSMAIRAAQEKATALTKELGVTLGKAISIEEQPQWWWSSYGLYSSRWGERGGGMMAQNAVQMAGGPGGGGDSTIAPGQIVVKADVRVVFALD